MPNKTVIQVPVTLSDVEYLRVFRASVGTVGCEATYTPKDDDGNSLGPRTSLVILTPAQQTSLTNFITNVIVPDANAKEGT